MAPDTKPNESVIRESSYAICSYYTDYFPLVSVLLVLFSCVFFYVPISFHFCIFFMRAIVVRVEGESERDDFIKYLTLILLTVSYGIKFNYLDSDSSKLKTKKTL